MSKRLYKDKKNEMIAGVCAGIANYFDLDPTLIRLAWVIFVIAGGSGILAYILCALIMPDEPDYYDV